MILMHAKMMLEWFGYLGKIILHRFISVVWLTNIMSELRNLIKPLCWVGQPFQSVKRFQSFFGKSDTLMIACCLLLQRNIHDYINITGTTFFLSQIWYCWRLSPHCVIQQPHWLSPSLVLMFLMQLKLAASESTRSCLISEIWTLVKHRWWVGQIM